MTGYSSAHPLFDRPEILRIPVNTTVEEQDIPRLSSQHEMILERLSAGPATNAELSKIAMRFGARLNELKRAGHPFSKIGFPGGLFVYFLVGVHSSDAAEQYGRERIRRPE